MISKLSMNNYLQCIFRLVMAEFRMSKMEVKYLLTESMAIFKKVVKEEDSWLENLSKDFFFITAFKKYRKFNDSNIDKEYPFSLLTKELLKDNMDKLPSPVIVGKSKNTVTLAFPRVKFAFNQT